MKQLRRRRLGRTGWEVTELGLGCFQFTGEFGIAQAEAGNILDLAIDSGINFLDTAAMYGFGESEELVARAVARHPGKRLYVSTKVGWLDRTVVRNLGDKAYQDESALRRAIAHSMWILRVEKLDVLMIHEPDWAQWGLNLETADSVVMNVLESLKKEGVISAIGMGGWNCDLMAKLIETGRFDVAMVAGGITLLNNTIREKILPAAKKHDTGIIIGGAMGQGALVVKDRAGAQEMVKNPKSPADAERGKKLLSIYDLSEETGLSLPEMAVRYAGGFEEIHTHIAGAREAGHLKSNLAAALAGPLPGKVVERIEAITRG